MLLIGKIYCNYVQHIIKGTYDNMKRCFVYGTPENKAACSSYILRIFFNNLAVQNAVNYVISGYSAGTHTNLKRVYTPYYFIFKAQTP